MSRFVLARLGQAVVALLLMSVIVFMLSRLTGDPVALQLSEYSTEEDRTRLSAELGLDRPLWQQFAIFLGKIAQGDLGRSVTGDRQSAFSLVAEHLPASLELAIAAFLISVTVGVPFGVIAAVHRGSAADFAARFFALLGQSVPVFWLGMVLMYFFSVRLRWLPTSGYGDPIHFVLPAVTMGLFTVAAITRLVRGSMLEALSSEYVKLARTKGLSEFKVVWKHALRNSLLPVVTFMGAFFATMITGAVVIETVFSWPGIGRLAYEAVRSRDFPVIQAVVLVTTALFIGANFLVDVLYAMIDPRIRYARKS